MFTKIRWRIAVPFIILFVLLMLALGIYLIGVARQLLVDEADIAMLRNTIAVAMGMAILIVTIAAVMVSGYIAQPLHELTSAAQKIAAGALDIKIFAGGRDEIGELAQAIGQMTVRLRDQIGELDAERNKLATILRQMNSGVVIVAPNREIMLLNPAAEEMFGVLEADVVSKSLVEGLRNHRVVELVAQANKLGDVRSLSLALPAQSRHLDMTAVALGEPLVGHVLLLFRDVTRLRQLETVRRDFVSNISHELRTPLASLKALTETLLTGALEDPPAARRFLTRIETEVDSLALIVQELLELARIESGRVPLALEPLAPKSLLKTAVERLHLQVARADLNVAIDVADGLPDVLADPPRLEQVLMNLIHNAIKFTPTGGRITVGATVGAGGVVFSVRDSGVGIAPDDLPRIFERFYKSDRARTHRGTGLGLAICRHLVGAHGGEIWVESALGRGSVFYFSLPLAQSQ